MDTCTFTNCLHSSQPLIQKKLTKLDTKNVKNSDFLSLLYSEPLRQYKKPKFKIGDRIRISKSDLSLGKCYTPQFTEEVFKIVATSSTKPPLYTKNNERDEIIRGKFYPKELIEII